jgi:hypothetical protein
MDQNKLLALLHQQDTEITERTPFCPDDYELAAFFDCNPQPPESEFPENHLVDCRYCLARVSILAQLETGNDEEFVPETLLAEAKQFGRQTRRRLLYAPAWAAAAAVIVTLFVIFGQDPTATLNSGAPPVQANHVADDIRQIRNIDRSSLAPSILAPARDAIVSADDLTLRWSSVSGSLYYDIRLVDEEGFLIWQDRVQDTQQRLPDDLGLISGEQYFVRVDAYLAEAKSVSSKHLQFTIKGNN